MQAISVEGVSKVFRVNTDSVYSLKERIIRLGRRHTREFHALQPIDLSIEVGETIGIMGHNGSGKSTLLKCIVGILTPTTGRVRVRGRMASLLELGAGFHPELTGRENVYINAAFLGISRREIERRFDDIVDFSELHDFIDEPVKHYSSGMYVRLGFAVAVNLDPDVLIVDEVLGVGDEKFQQKCLDRVRGFQREGRTIVAVTHSADMVRQVCQRAIVLDHGSMVADARPVDAIRIFREHLHGELQESPHSVDDRDRTLEITGATIEMPDSEGRPALQRGESLRILIDYAGRAPIASPMLGLEILAVGGQAMHRSDLADQCAALGSLPARGTIVLDIPSIPLLEGTYTVSFNLADRADPNAVAWREGLDQIRIAAATGRTRSFGIIPLDIAASLRA